jgi:Zn-dependent protease
MGSAIFTLKQATLDILYYAALINVILGAFNLIPAFPSDGGRILRAALVRLRKDYNKGTKDAVNVGIIISYGFMAFGFVMMVTGSFLSGTNNDGTICIILCEIPIRATGIYSVLNTIVKWILKYNAKEVIVLSGFPVHGIPGAEIRQRNS